MAMLYLKGMSEPVAIDYKDQVPSHATRDNPLRRAGTGDGAAAANIPGVVAGLDLLYRRYASKKLPWSDLVAPAIRYADGGFELDASLPTSIAEGRRFFAKYPASARIYLPAATCRARRSLRQQATTPRRSARSRRTARTRSIVARSRAGSPTTWRRTAG